MDVVASPTRSTGLGALGLNRPGVVATLVGLALFGLHVSTLTSDHTYDAVLFAMLSESAVASGFGGLDLWHPHHVLYNAAAAGGLAAVTALGAAIGGLAWLQLLSAASGAVVGALAFLRLHAWTRSEFLAAGGALCLAASSGVWFFSTNAECDMPALAAALLAVGPAQAFVESGRRRDAVLGAALLAVTCALHLTLGLLWIGLLVAAAASSPAALRRAVVLLAGASVLLAASYAPRALLLARTPEGLTPRGLVSFTGERYGAGYLLQEGFHPRAELAEILHGFAASGEGLAGAAATALRVVPLAWLAAGLFALVRRRGGVAACATGAWFLGAWLLFALWAGRNFEFTPFEVVPLALWGTVALGALVPTPRWRDRAGLALLVAAAATGIVNWVNIIRPGLDPAANEMLAVAETVRDATRPGDRVLVTGQPDPRLKVYVIYFSARQPIIPEFVFGPRISTEESMRRLELRLVEACEGGGRLFALPALVEDEPRDAAWPIDAVRERLARLRPVPAARGRDGVLLYRLDCP